MILLIALILNGHVINLVRQVETVPVMNKANIQEWDGGTLIYAHDFLSGGEFFDLDMGEPVEGIYSDGSTRMFTVSQEGIYYLSTNMWENTIHQFSDTGHLTLITCVEDGRLMIELNPTEAVGAHKW